MSNGDDGADIRELLRALLVPDEPGEAARRLAEFREACRRADSDPAERQRIADIAADSGLEDLCLSGPRAPLETRARPVTRCPASPAP